MYTNQELIYDLRTMDMNCPLGIDTEAPDLSWRLNRISKSALEKLGGISACAEEHQKLDQQPEWYKQEKLSTYENYSGGELTNDAYLKQWAEIDARISTVQFQRDEQE